MVCREWKASLCPPVPIAHNWKKLSGSICEVARAIPERLGMSRPVARTSEINGRWTALKKAKPIPEDRLRLARGDA